MLVPVQVQDQVLLPNWDELGMVVIKIDIILHLIVLILAVYLCDEIKILLLNYFLALLRVIQAFQIFYLVFPLNLDATSDFVQINIQSF